MKLKVEIVITVPHGNKATVKDIQKWLEYEVGMRDSLSIRNPLASCYISEGIASSVSWRCVDSKAD